MTDCSPFDVWNLESFDGGLRAILEVNSDLIRNYLLREREILEAYDLAHGLNRPSVRPQNQFATDYIRLQEKLEAPMVERQIRAFHYTRLTDCEVVRIFKYGIHLSTPESLQKRLLTLQQIGAFTLDEINTIAAESPFHTQFGLNNPQITDFMQNYGDFSRFVLQDFE